MVSPILDALPAIHVTVIGIGGAFFSAFAMFAYQRVQETKDQLEKVLKEIEAFSTPTNYIGTQQNDLLLQSGELDWDGKAKQLLHHAKSLFSYLDYEEKYGIPRGDFRGTPSADELAGTCQNLCLLLHFLFVSYPFTGRSMVHIQGVTEKLEAKKREPFDKVRLKEIERRVGFLLWCWDTSNRSLLELARVCTEIEHEKKVREVTTAFEENIAKMKVTSEEERKRIWTTFHQPHLSHRTDYSQIIVEYFNKVRAYRTNVLPALQEALHTHERYNERFRVKSLTLLTIKLISTILVFGVLVPPILQSARTDFGLAWEPWLAYFLLFITTAPYFIVCWLLYKKVRALSYQ